MFISYSSSKVLKLISVDHYMKSFPVNWALGEILEKRVMKTNGLVVLVQLEDNVLACINGTLDFSDCIGNKNK